MMKSIGIWILAAAAVTLGWVAWRSPEQSYVASPSEQVEPEAIPLAITAAANPGDVVRTFDVEGMCCNGCTGKLFKALEEYPGVSAAAVSFKHGTAQASVPADLDPSVLAAVLTFDKYSAVLSAN